MGITVITHIAAGTVGLVTGYVALGARKGGVTHRRVGEVFVYAMVVIGLLGSAMAAWQLPARPGVGLELTTFVGLLTAHLVVSSLATVRPVTACALRAQVIAGVAIALAFLTLAGAALVSPQGTRDGMPPLIYLIFGGFATLAATGDVSVLLHGERRGAKRQARHLWRMCIALLIAAFSFFVGQAQVLPEALRVPLLLALPEIAVVASMLYWLGRTWRRSRPSHVRPTASRPSIVGVTATS